MNGLKVTADVWANEYLSTQDALSLMGFQMQMHNLVPIHRSMKGIKDRQKWLDEYGRVCWETSKVKQALGAEYLTTDADELDALLDQWLEEVSE